MQKLLLNSRNLFVVVFWIVTLSFFVFSRFMFLDYAPKGLNWDEASYAYNAYSLLKTGSDEWGKSLPLYLKAFGDFKPALLSYAMVGGFSLFGVSDSVARGTVGVISGVGLLGLYFFVKKISDEKVAKLVLLFCVLSPWHIHFSRIAMDPMMGFSLAMIGFCLIVQKRLLIQIAGIIFLLGSMYSYHAEKILVPIVVLFLVLTGKSFIKRRIFIASGTIFVTLLLFGYTSFFGTNQRIADVFNLNRPEVSNAVNETMYRSNVANIPNQRILNNKLWQMAPLILKNYFLHFQPDFLFFNNSLGPRHSFSRYGNLLLASVPFLIIGFVVLSQKKKPSINLLFIVWLLISPLPAAFTTDVPHAGRVLFILPAFGFLFAKGVLWVRSIWPKKILSHFLYVLVLLLFSLNFAAYFRDYYLYFPEESYTAFQGYMEPLSIYVSSQTHSYDMTILNNITTNSYIFYSWYQKVDPTVIQKAHQSSRVNEITKLSQLSFLSIDDEDLYCNLLKPNTLIISGPSFPEAVVSVSHSRFDSFNRFHPPDKLFDIYDTNMLEATLSAISVTRCKQ